MNANRKRLTSKIALVVSIVLLVSWGILGTGASLAWFQAESSDIKNVFNFGTFDVEVEYKNDRMTDFAPLENQTAIFNDEALYEPGYTQIVHMKITNKSTMDVRYKLTVKQRQVVTAYDAEGDLIYLPKYIKYGAVFADSVFELDRAFAQQNAPHDMAQLSLGEYSQWDEVVLAPEQERYVVLIVYMPEEVGNKAKYRDDHPPRVELGITIDAQQTNAPQL